MDLNNLLQRIDSLKKEIDALPPVSKEQLDLFNKKIKLEFHYNTNHIEGNTLTYGETDLLFTFGELRGNHTLREVEEMKASDVALMMVQEQAADKERPITEGFIKELNKTLLVEPYYKDAITPDGRQTQKKIKIGEYKDQPNNVRLANGEVFQFSSVTDTPIQMQELVDWAREALEKSDLHPVLIAATLHYRFVRIHPFDDGNGRVSRLLMNYVLYYYGYPPVVIKSADKKNYLSALHDADTGNLQSFYVYVANELVWSLELLLKAFKGESLEEENDWEKELAVLKANLKNREDLKAVRTPDILLALIKEEIVGFFAALNKKIIPINEMFLHNMFFFKSRKGDIYNLEEITDREKIIAEFYDGILLDGTFYNFLKNGSGTFTLTYKFAWFFDEASFTLIYPSLSGDKSISKLYHERLGDSETNNVIGQVAKKMLRDIQDRIAAP